MAHLTAGAVSSRLLQNRWHKSHPRTFHTAASAAASEMLALLAPSLALTLSCGGRSLRPQSLPPFLEPYNDRSRAHRGGARRRSCALQTWRGLRCGAAPTLDVWAPATPVTSPLPIVFGIHGGGWEFGYPEWAGFPARQICAASALYVTPAYTLGGGGERQSWPSARDDLLLALRWVIDHAAQEGGDPTRLILTGHSAGGHYAATLGLDPPLLREAGIDPASVKALFLVSCPVGLRAEDFAPKRWLWRLYFGRPLIKRLYNKVISRNLATIVGTPPDPALAAGFAAARHEAAAPAELPPLVHVTYGGGKDFPFCKPQARRLQFEAARLGEEGRASKCWSCRRPPSTPTSSWPTARAVAAALRRVLADE